MAKKASTTSEPVAEVNEQKMRKKQAKREAKLMLEIEETKVSIERAEKKLAKAQARLEARNAHLRTLEADLSEFRISHQENEVAAPDSGFDHQSGQPETEEETEIIAQHGDTEQQSERAASEDEEANEIIAQHSDSEQQSEQPVLEAIAIIAEQGGSEQQTDQLVSEDEEATILPDAGLDHQTGQPEPEETSTSNQ
jgi:hypothetical protein